MQSEEFNASGTIHFFWQGKSDGDVREHEVGIAVEKNTNF